MRKKEELKKIERKPIGLIFIGTTQCTFESLIIISLEIKFRALGGSGGHPVFWFLPTFFRTFYASKGNIIFSEVVLKAA